MDGKRISIVAAAAAGALVLALAGCGGGGGKSSSQGNAGGGGGSSGSPAKNCKEFSQAATKVGQQFASALTNASGSADVEKAAKLFDELTSKAPSDIKSDFQVIDDAFQKLAEALKGVDLKNPTQDELKRIQKVSQEIDQQKLQKAQANITAWAKNNCK